MSHDAEGSEVKPVLGTQLLWPSEAAVTQAFTPACEVTPWLQRAPSPLRLSRVPLRTLPCMCAATGPEGIMAAAAVLLLLAATEVSSLVRLESGVEVRRGRSAFVTERQLRISAGPGADCKVEVVTNEPITQRVGRLTPQVRTGHASSHGPTSPDPRFLHRCLTARSRTITSNTSTTEAPNWTRTR